MGDTIPPEVLWAQRSSATDPAKNVVYLTINVPDIQESTLVLDLTSTSISFKAHAGVGGEPGRDYVFDLKFYGEIDPEPLSRALSSRGLSLILRKRWTTVEYWARLTKDTGKYPFIRADFAHWVDEDDQDGIAIIESAAALHVDSDSDEVPDDEA